MAEIYGEREGTRRMTNMVLQSQASRGAIERNDKGKHIERKKAMDLDGSSVAAWLAEACLRYNGRALLIASIESSPAIYPFVLVARQPTSSPNQERLRCGWTAPAIRSLA